MSASHSPDSDESIQRLETHRAFAREIDQKFAKVYGYGGASVLAAVILTLTVAYSFGVLGRIATWMIALTLTLIALRILKARVEVARSKLRDKVQRYCETNDLEVSELLDYYRREDVYPYLRAVFEQRPSPDSLPDDS